MAKPRRKSFLLRIDERLLTELNRWADQEFRSLNGQIEMILQRAVNDRRKRPDELGPR
ncbi:Arc family DNA-binding protein [Dehalogenimonas formicexedens]|nr:Arc family DNA-binding protein [Dehalogenimonas formicexedens]